MADVAEKKKRVFSGIQPSGQITLGNYLGALKNWVELQDEYECLYCVVNQHAITVRTNPQDLKKNTLSAYALLIACGVDPEQSTLFIQSHAPAHSQLAWVLNCYTPFGELSRMTQFKDKSAKNTDNINAGLFTYPALMAADILVYGADYVPVGEDQRQHLELTRDIVVRFNGIHGDVLKMPNPYIPKFGAKIMSLSDPTRKMSKSDTNPRGSVHILDEPNVILKNFKSAVTDSETEVVFREGKEGINNLLTIYSLVSDRSIESIQNDFVGKGYGDFKAAVGNAVAEYLSPIRERYKKLMAEPKKLEEYYRLGAQKANIQSNRILEKIYKKVGFINL